MEYVTLKNTDIKVSRLCMGGCPMGQYGWGNVCEQELLESVDAAVDQGVTFFDTADTYGLGRSEITLGKALGNKRQDVVIASKFGIRVENGKTFYDNSPTYIEKALISSLKRLNTDYIDLYQIHYRDGITPIADVLGTLERMEQKGYIRAFGLSNMQRNNLPELEAYKGKFASLQDEYSLACRKNEADLKVLSEKLELTPMTWGSLGQGVLTGKYGSDVSFDKGDRRRRAVYVNFHGEKLMQNLKIVEVMRSVAANHSVPVSAVAVRFILDYIADSVVLVGIKRPDQIMDNVRAMNWHLNEDEIAVLEGISAY